MALACGEISAGRAGRLILSTLCSGSESGHAGDAYFRNSVSFAPEMGEQELRGLAEAMTIFAVMCAGIFPAIHTGRPWLDGYLFPLSGSAQALG